MTSEVMVVHAHETPPDAWEAAVFLAGPTPRDAATPSWRPEAIAMLRDAWQHEGRLVVFTPEPRGGFGIDYTGQIAWETTSLNFADVIVFWVPRDMKRLPALTTNVEWGAWADSGKAVFGAPPQAPHTRYLLHAAQANHVPTATTLDGTVTHALASVGAGAHRRGGERAVPLLVWHTDSFQRWYTAQRKAGNTLNGARVAWTCRIGPKQRFVLYWAVHVEVVIAAEGRVKSNEVVLSRPDTAHVLLYRPAVNLDDTPIVLVREFRSPASTPDGFVHELPGGSSIRPVAPDEQAAAEVREETGLEVASDRLRPHGSRQVAATALAYQADLFSAELTDAELAWLHDQAGQPHGVTADSEQTWVEIATYGEIRRERLVDWATLGMIAQVITP